MTILEERFLYVGLIHLLRQLAQFNVHDLHIFVLEFLLVARPSRLKPILLGNIDLLFLIVNE